jgi:6-pyruvoyltetrahydropterin/6-carboxytetrahydropterin synthase
MYIIKKQFHFSASHIIEGLPPEHQCGRLHGHNYAVEIVLEAEELDEVGFVVDYGDLKPFKAILDDELDHRHLNDILPGSTTAESIAAWLYGRAKAIWPEVSAVRVSETPRTWAEYRPRTQQ